MVRWIVAITALATAVTVTTAKPLTGRFIHITDIHYDPTYKAGTDPKQLCHRGKQNEDTGDGAGEYGAVNTDCDSPKKLVDLTFEFLKKNLSDVDFVVYTGDSARHNRDKEIQRTLKDVISDQEVVVNYFRETFGDTPVLPVIGNNDVEPHNNADLNDKQFQAIHNLWQPLNLNMTQDFLRGGFLTHDVIPGKLRTIHTNTLLFMKKNDKTKDCDKLDSPGWAHMSWIRSVLDDARARKISVYVLAHVPPNNRKDKAYFRDACLEQYYHLLGSYSDVVAAHFAGHYNDDVLTAVLDNGGTYSHATATPSKKGIKGLQKSQKFVTPVFNSPSIIPDNNPAVRVFEYDLDGKHGKFGTITNWKQYYLDLGANTDQEKNDMKYDFQVEYDAKEVYKIEAFDGPGMQKLFQTISKDDGVSSKYIEYSTVSTDVDDE